MRLKFAVVYGSVREAREGYRAAMFVSKQLEKRGHTAVLVDPVLYSLPMINKMYKEYPKDTAPEAMEILAEIFREADGIVVVSGEYNHLPPPALTNMLDHFMEEYFFKPSAIVTYSSGSFGGIRAGSHLRDYLCELGMSSIPSDFPIGRVQDSIDEKGVAVDKDYNRRIKRFIDELEFYSRALKSERKKGVPY